MILLLVAGIIRFYQYGQIQFSHDELSALNRTGYQSFKTLIEEGVMIEGHPAGVQVFLHYYTDLIGYEEIWVKLPFTLLGLGSLIIVLGIGQSLNRVNTGLVVAACMAVMQHFVMYSQLSRPYVVGYFFGLLAGYFWIRYFYRQRKLINLLGFSLSAAAAAYSHQFSLLLIALMGFTGLLKVKRSDNLWYLGACLATFILYLPHLGIFFHQLSLGGIGSWLGKPQPDFLLTYLGYTFHYSWIFAGTAGLVLVYGLYQKKAFSPLFWEGILWFGITFLAGYFYSVAVNPVLQFSGLVFAFPFLLFSIFSAVKISYPIVSTLLILVSGSLSLYKNRLHYPLFYKSAYAYPLEVISTSSLANAPLVHNLFPPKLEYYKEKYHLDESRFFHLSEGSSFHNLKRAIHQRNSDTLVIAASDGFPLEFIHFLMQEYPQLIKQENLFNLTLWQVCRKGDSDLNSLLTVPGQEEASRLGANESYSQGFDYYFPDTLKIHPEDYFLSRWELSTHSSFSMAEIASALYSGDSLLRWETIPLSTFQSDSSFRAYQAFRIPSEFRNKPDLHLKIFIYNLDGLEFTYCPLGLDLYKGNRRKYGLYYPFPK